MRRRCTGGVAPGRDGAFRSSAIGELMQKLKANDSRLVAATALDRADFSARERHRQGARLAARDFTSRRPRRSIAGFVAIKLRRPFRGPLLESELFRSCAARRVSRMPCADKSGLFEDADGGPRCFSTRSASLPMGLQVKLLRAPAGIREIRRVGDTASIKVDVRPRRGDVARSEKMTSRPAGFARTSTID